MSTLVNNYLRHLNNIEKGECWYLVKQDTSFWKQCYFVSILESFKKQSNTLNFESFFSSKIEELNTKKKSRFTGYSPSITGCLFLWINFRS